MNTFSGYLFFSQIYIPLDLFHFYIYISSPSSRRTISTDIPDPLSPPLPIVPLLPAGLQGYIPHRHRAAVCRFELIVLPLLVHVKGSTGLHHL